ncbi:CBS domain protein [compost metagenome]
MDLVPLFSHGGHHHIPIVDPEARLVGVITQTDLVRTLAITVQGRDDDVSSGAPRGQIAPVVAAKAGP